MTEKLNPVQTFVYRAGKAKPIATLSATTGNGQPKKPKLTKAEKRAIKMAGMTDAQKAAYESERKLRKQENKAKAKAAKAQREREAAIAEKKARDEAHRKANRSAKHRAARKASVSRHVLISDLPRTVKQPQAVKPSLVVTVDLLRVKEDDFHPEVKPASAPRYIVVNGVVEMVD